MSRNTLITIGIIIVIIVAAIVLTTTDGHQNSDNNTEETATTTTGFVPALINGIHQYDEVAGVHTIAGQADVATACHQLEVETQVSEANVVTILFTATADEDQMCAQVITSRDFETSFSASDDVTIEAAYNGEPVELNLRMVEGDSDINESEVYSKG